MHGPNFNEMLETKENILRLTYTMTDSIPLLRTKSNTVIKKKVESFLRNITYMSLSKVICPILKVFCTS
jgi:hypothetical protein